MYTPSAATVKLIAESVYLDIGYPPVPPAYMITIAVRCPALDSSSATRVHLEDSAVRLAPIPRYPLTSPRVFAEHSHRVF